MGREAPSLTLLLIPQGLLRTLQPLSWGQTSDRAGYGEHQSSSVTGAEPAHRTTVHSSSLVRTGWSIPVEDEKPWGAEMSQGGSEMRPWR